MTAPSSPSATRDEEQYPAPIDLLTAEIEKLKRETDGGWSPDARSSLARIEFFTRRVLVEQIQSAESERAEPIDSARWQAIEWRWGSGTVTLDCDEKGFFRIQVEHAEAADEYVTGKDPADVLNKLMKFDAEHAEETTAPSAEARRIDYGSMWGFMRSVLTQGAAIYQDFAAGNLKDYEEYSARVDAAARERDDELKSLPSATAATWKPIATAPTDGTEILLTQWSEQDGYGETDFGSWGFIENSDADQQAIYGWLSNYGRVDEPTHWMEVATPDRSSQ